MFFLDKPYISDFLKQTIKEYNIPVVDMGNGLYSGKNLITKDTAIKLAKQSKNPTVYTTSENAIGWISKNLDFTDLPKQINIFKDKVKFRDTIKSIYPDFYYKSVKLSKLKELNFDMLKSPFIIKPSVGFFSMGVYRVDDIDGWNKTLNSIEKEMIEVKDLYPTEVMGTEEFIIEEIIEGDEFAFDAYFDDYGNPVILGILKHLFSSGDDVSDRVYITSKNIINNNLEDFTNFLVKIGKLTGVKNFPVHVEVRKDNRGKITPIEINPMRFGGWCTTADLSYLAYGINPYVCYYSKIIPDWNKALEGKDSKLFAIVVLDNSTGEAANNISSFNYEKLLSNFKKPLELRKIDYNEYPVFGFIFTETNENNLEELTNILHSNLREFISI